MTQSSACQGGPDALPLIHLAYRPLLQRQHLRAAPPVLGPTWLAVLIVQGEPRRALGVLHESPGLDPGFIPDDIRSGGEVADLTPRPGISRIAAKLGQGYRRSWPRDRQAPCCGLLAARLLAEPPDQQVEAMQLVDQLAAGWLEHPWCAEIEQQRPQLANPA
ncbi:MAG: hypothetical protein ABI389_05830 [Rhodanobacter sp.]